MFQPHDGHALRAICLAPLLDNIRSLAGGGTSNRDWWPAQLRLDLLHQHSSKSDPMGESFDYAKEFQSRDFVNAWTKVMNLDRFDLSHADSTMRR